MAMMKTTIAMEMINDGNGDNEISKDDNDDSDSNDTDYVYTRQFFDLIRGPKKIDCTRQGPTEFTQVYPSLPWPMINRSCMQFVLIRRPKRGQNAPQSRITTVF